MASLRILARSKLSSIFQACLYPDSASLASSAVIQIQKKNKSYLASPQYKDPSRYTDFQISADPNEWKYVERLLPYKVVPLPKTTQVTSGWRPQNVTDKDLPYFVPRSKNHMQPVYLIRSKRGMRKLTYIRKIQGDIWKLEADLKKFVEGEKNKRLASRINELAAVVILHGDHVSAVKKWLGTKGF